MPRETKRAEESSDGERDKEDRPQAVEICFHRAHPDFEIAMAARITRIRLVATCRIVGTFCRCSIITQLQETVDASRNGKRNFDALH